MNAPNQIMLAEPERPALSLDVPAEDLRRQHGRDRVYFLLAPSVGLVKIGTTWRLADRVADLRLMSPVPLELVGHIAGDVETEAAYHLLFTAERSHGEWFRYTGRVADRLGRDCLIGAWNEAPVGARKKFLALVKGGAASSPPPAP
jgi:hypothetical protein